MQDKIERALAALAEAGRTLAKVRSIGAVKEIHDAAEAQIAAAKRAGLPREVQNALAELSLRAARRGGELLAETPLSYGGRPRKDIASTHAKTLRELGLNKNQSSRWRRLATIPVELFEGHLAESRRLGKAPSAAKLLRLAAELARGKRAKTPKPPQPAISEQPSSAGPASADISDDLVELQEHMEHFGDLFKSFVDMPHKQPPAMKRHAATVLKEMHEIVAKLRRYSTS